MQYEKTTKDTSIYRQINIVCSMLSTFHSRIIVVAFITLIVVVVVHIREGRVLKLSELGKTLDDVHQPNDRLKQYCNKHLWMSGIEGRSFPGNENWELKYLALTIRHGDRSAIHTVPGSKRLSIRNNDEILLDPGALHFNPRLSSYKTSVQADTKSKVESEQDILIALNPSIAFRTADLNLTQGQLTSRGFMQHVRLGEKLQSRYSELSDRVTHNEQIYVRSTKYIRTIQSVTGLMMSFLPSLGTSSLPVDISVFGNEEDEVMHGIGLRSSSHTTGLTAGSSGGEVEYSGSCESAVSYAKKQKDVFAPSRAMEKRLVDIFGGQVLNKTQNEIADASVPSLCHGVPLPCAASGALRRSFSQQCLQHSDLLFMMEEADRSYCEKYTGDRGGRNATSRAIYPFMKEILSHLAASAAAPVTVNNGGGDKPKHNRVMSLFSGHDTVIAPVLAALGVYRDELCGWPSYASHIIFELWQRRGSPEQNYVRVLYNGADLTQRIPTCRAERLDMFNRKQSGGVVSGIESELLADQSPLCSLKALTQQIEGMIQPYSSIQEACKL